jgi:phage gp29-like protein
MQQAMFLMNNLEVDAQLKAGEDHETKLAKILKETSDDRLAIERLFRSVLARPASEEELRIGLEFVQEVNNRHEAFEDLLWALLNSAEFTTRH